MKIYEKYKDKGDIHYQWYENNTDGFRDWVDFVIGLFPNSKNKTLLDLGCGEGLWSQKLAEKGYHVMGIDSSEYGIKIAREKNPDIEFYVTEAEFLDRSNMSEFDVMISMDVIEHLKNSDYFRRIFSYYVKDYLIFSTPKKEPDARISPNHYKEYTKDELRKFFEDCGFKIEFIETPGLKGKWSDEKTILAKVSQ